MVVARAGFACDTGTLTGSLAGSLTGSLTGSLFEMASSSQDERERLEHASLRIATNLGPNRFGEGLKRAATMALDFPRRKFRAFERAILFGAMRFRR